MRNLILSSIFLLLFFTCTRAQSEPGSGDQKYVVNPGYWRPVFPDTFQKGLFRMNLDIGKHRLSGVLLIKRVADSSTRIIFTNEMGLRFFDFEFLNGRFEVRYIFPSMDKKMLISLLRKDFTMILMHEKVIRSIRFITNVDAETYKYGVSSDEGKFRYFVNNGSKKIKELRTSGSFMGNTVIHPEYSSESYVPLKISIHNPKIKLRAVMILLKD